MTSGGARARSGPAPSPTAIRPLSEERGWTKLPAAGRKARAPKWPLVEATDRELVLWRALWRRPQALMWEQYGQGLEVALYVRRLAEAELPESPVTLGTLVRQMGDSLGLTTPGLRANRWRIVADVPAVPEPVAAPAAPAAPRRSSRSRFQIVRDDEPDG